MPPRQLPRPWALNSIHQRNVLVVVKLELDLHIRSSRAVRPISSSEDTLSACWQPSNMLDSSPFVIRHRISDSRSKRLCFQTLPETRAHSSHWHPGCISRARTKKNFSREIAYGYCSSAKPGG